MDSPAGKNNQSKWLSLQALPLLPIVSRVPFTNHHPLVKMLDVKGAPDDRSIPFTRFRISWVEIKR